MVNLEVGEGNVARNASHACNRGRIVEVAVDSVVNLTGSIGVSFELESITVAEVNDIIIVGVGVHPDVEARVSCGILRLEVHRKDEHVGGGKPLGVSKSGDHCTTSVASNFVATAGLADENELRSALNNVEERGLVNVSVVGVEDSAEADILSYP